MLPAGTARLLSAPVQLQPTHLSPLHALHRYTQDEIDKEVGDMRASMMAEQAALTDDQKLEQLREQDETHALAKRKQVEMAKFASALGVKNAVRSHVPPPHSCLPAFKSTIVCSI